MLSYISILFVILICYITNNITSNIEIIVLLGCNNNAIQNQRVLSTINYINSKKKPIILYISGGSKLGNTPTEASIMYQRIKNIDSSIDIHIDDKSKNTAENFLYLKEWMNKNNFQNEKITITTSDFHKNRAEKFLNKIFNKININWNLSISNCKWCWEDELIHMKNVNNDILLATSKIII